MPFSNINAAKGVGIIRSNKFMQRLTIHEKCASKAFKLPILGNLLKVKRGLHQQEDDGVFHK